MDIINQEIKMGEAIYEDNIIKDMGHPELDLVINIL